MAAQTMGEFGEFLYQTRDVDVSALSGADRRRKGKPLYRGAKRRSGKVVT